VDPHCHVPLPPEGAAADPAPAQHPGRQAARSFYLLLQIAHLFAQLFEAHLGDKKHVAHYYGSLQNLARLLLEAFRTDRLPFPQDADAFLDIPIQVRLDVDTS